MAKGIVTSFRVEAATNGFSLNYCIKTKTPATAGQTYGNTDYKDHEEVFMQKDRQLLLDRIADLIGIESADEDKGEGAADDGIVIQSES